MPLICYKRKKFSDPHRRLLEVINRIVAEYQDQGYSLTLRQVYYVLVSKALIENNLKSYKAIGDLVSDARMAGIVDWDAIDDRLRELRDIATWGHPRDILSACASQFKLDLWKGQTFRPEVWVEKESLAEIVVKAAQELRVPVMVCRGYMSMSAMWEAGCHRFRRYAEDSVIPVVIHLGDHDPSGIDMSRDIEARVSLFSDTAVRVDRIALNMDQVEQYRPPPNPAKVTDSRARAYIAAFGRESWELDALDPRVLHDLIQKKIREFLDPELWNDKTAVEASIRDRLQKLADNFEY